MRGGGWVFKKKGGGGGKGLSNGRNVLNLEFIHYLCFIREGGRE